MERASNIKSRVNRQSAIVSAQQLLKTYSKIPPNGLYQAITRRFKECSLIKEKNIILKFMTEISKDTGMYIFGLYETLLALESGAVNTLLVSENINGPMTRTEDIKKMEELKCENIIEWLLEHIDEYGAKLEILSMATAEGTQFANSFRIGAITRYKFTIDNYNDQLEPRLVSELDIDSKTEEYNKFDNEDDFYIN